MDSSSEFIYGTTSILLMFVLTLYAFISTYLEHKEIYLIHEATVGIILGTMIGIPYKLAF